MLFVWAVCRHLNARHCSRPPAWRKQPDTDFLAALTAALPVLVSVLAWDLSLRVGRVAAPREWFRVEAPQPRQPHTRCRRRLPVCSVRWVLPESHVVVVAEFGVLLNRPSRSDPVNPALFVADCPRPGGTATRTVC